MSDGDDTSVAEEEEEEEDVDNLTPESRASTFSRMGELHRRHLQHTWTEPIAVDPDEFEPEGHAPYLNMHASGE